MSDIVNMTPAELAHAMRDHVVSRGGLAKDAATGEVILRNGAWAMMLKAAETLCEFEVTIARQKELLERAANTLTKCTIRFGEYEVSHLAKRTADGDMKAARNAEMANICETTLRALKENQ